MPDASRVPRRRWGIALLLGFGVLVNYFDRVNLSVSQQALTESFGMSAVMFGYLSSAYNVTYAALQLPSGLILDRFGVRLVGRISTVLWSVASFAAAVATGIRSLFAARFLLGVGEAPTFPANAKATGYWFPKQERSLATAMFDSAAKFAPGRGCAPDRHHAAAHRLALELRRHRFHQPDLLRALLRLLSQSQRGHEAQRGRARLHRARRRAARRQAKAAQGAPLLYLLGKAKVWGLVLGFASYNYTFYLLLAWLPSYLASTHHIEPVFRRPVYRHSVALLRIDRSCSSAACSWTPSSGAAAIPFASAKRC